MMRVVFLAAAYSRGTNVDGRFPIVGMLGLSTLLLELLSMFQTRRVDTVVKMLASQQSGVIVFRQSLELL